MAGTGVVASPVLVGRDEFLQLVRRRLTEAQQGSGELLLVSGEAGIGKTRLLRSVVTQARTMGFAVARAAAFPADTASSAGLLLDLAADLRAAPDQEQRDLGERLGERVRADSGADEGDAHHRRRRLEQDVAALLAAAGPARPWLIVLEDLHWADQVSLDVLARLAPRLSSRPLLIAAAYRSDELAPGRPLRELRARLLPQRLAEEIRLPRLSLEQVSVLAAAVTGTVVPSQVIRAVHQRSDGIPLHVEELLACLDHGSLTPQSGAQVQAAAVPETLGDALLSRLGALSGRARAVATAAAVLGRSFDFDLLTDVTGSEPDDVATALRELREASLVLPGADEVTFDFRHALIRDALYADTDLPDRRRLHARVAEAAVARGHRSAVVSAHYELAGQADRAFGQAREAAQEARSMSAHGEALELYRRALRNCPKDLDTRSRAELLAELGDEASAVDDNLAAAQAFDQAYGLYLSMGDVLGAAAIVPRRTAVGHLLGEGLNERVSRLQQAVRLLDDAGLAAPQKRAGLRSALAAAYMLDRRLDEAIAAGQIGVGAIEAGEVGEGSSAEDDTALNTAVTLGSVLVFAGRSDEGWQLLESSIAQARRRHREAEAARGYRMIATSASVLVEYDRSRHWLEAGIAYAEAVELWNHRHYLAAHLAHVRWATGEWATAEAGAGQALADGRGGITTRITAQYVLGYLALGRADWARAENLLGEALHTGTEMAELQRFSPPLWGLAEMARCRDDFALAVELSERGYEASAQVKDAAYLYPYLITGVRSHLALNDQAAAEDWFRRVSEVLRGRAVPGTLPALTHAYGLLRLAEGDLESAPQLLAAAVRDWAARGRFWEGSWARLDLARAALRQRRRGEALRLLAEVRTAAEQAGSAVLLAAVDRQAGPAPEVPWHPLTAREFEVARLVAEGLTNRQIAERLVLAPKTISAHVEHILTKLGAARRAEIAAWCAQVTSGPVSENRRA